MLEIVLTPEILGPFKIGGLGLSLFSLMVNLRLVVHKINSGRLTRYKSNFFENFKYFEGTV